MSSKDFLFLGNHLALDFINTEFGVGERYDEKFECHDDVINWLRTAGLNVGNGAFRCADILPLARELRNDMKNALQCAQYKQEYSVDCVNHILAESSPSPQLVWIEDQNRFVIEQKHSSQSCERLLQPIADAFIHLLAEYDLSLVKQCEADDCVLVFHDQTKSHKRRWCSMALCGNRMKAAAHRKRNQQQRHKQV